ncbi:MAG TPA: SUMF1/EgtB/PvdO family nonheme iron enzyme [Polyangiaceae bacterium]|nr:SUMF1/EgtB/PvdO family nonheme iron enzyme [Polyangiaceae bacterium]HNZ24373.1 SUMF1/EgtB/PvdO family nonheme iron enzyme [Polyangiaceae bacterium]HOD22605.1 SUMF1/EgtB/PvdO family nonheme iron enzyme [Polyangiaceae bacterium]HOE50451.1 SUMF1/EgtB/PvdO family nonheme iron enzyme [Polyangiaceae bacterium]HOH02429.1 SUMF1/EgtB/PvdO family nonheme iron enzyme [Polyangiaceae bacterium]
MKRYDMDRMCLGAIALWLLVLGSCKSKGASSDSPQEQSTEIRPSSTVVLSAAPEQSEAAGTHRPVNKKLEVGQKVDIPSGAFLSGSTPGDRGRDASLEPALVKVELGAYSIDRLPYPNDPSMEPRTGVTRREAEQLCAERKQRLCTELEWERACKGPEENAYSTGQGWDGACEKQPQACASGFDVVGMGTIREWTSSDWDVGDGESKTSAVLRGGRKGVADTEHRCARRELADAQAQGMDLGFRCCGGAANAARVSKPPTLPTFRRAKLDASQVASMLRTVPQLADLGEVKFFQEPDDVNRVVARGDAGRQGNTLTTSPLLWSPALGEELLVMAGLGASGSSFIAAFHRLPDDRYRIASTFVLKNDPGPIVLGFNGWVKNRLTWSSCWGCIGEEGLIVHRDQGRIVIEQR